LHKYAAFPATDPIDAKKL